MSDLEALVRAYFAACSRGDAAGVAEFFCPDAVVYDTNHSPIDAADRRARVRHPGGSPEGGLVNVRCCVR